MHNMMADESGLTMNEVSHHRVILMQLSDPHKSQRLHGSPDPGLSGLGIQQSEDMAIRLSAEMKRGMPVPEVWTVSTLRRTGQTCRIHWDWLFRAEDQAPSGQDAESGYGPKHGKARGVPAIVVEVSLSQAHAVANVDTR